MKVAAFDMDNTILRSSFIESAATAYGFGNALTAIRKDKNALTRTKGIAGLLKGRDRVEMLELTDSIGIAAGLAHIIPDLRKRGYVTGIISDSYDFVTNHLKEKYGFDFTFSNELEFVNGRVTGNVRIPSVFAHSEVSLCGHAFCKLNVLLHFCHHHHINLQDTLVIGDGENDICCLRQAGIGISFCSTHETVDAAAKHVIKKRDFGLMTVILDRIVQLPDIVKACTQ